MEPREETFRRLYAAHFGAVLGYASRRTDRPEDAADVVAETFVVAWRRIGHVPIDGSLPWLYAVARRLLANQRRGELRRRRLGERLRRDLYSANDHTTIGVVQDGWYAEVRGSGMGEAAYLALLAQVRAVSDADYEAALPETFVTDAERRLAINEMTSDMAMPDGFGVSSDQSDRYQLGAEVSGAVACAWLGRWVKGRQIGDAELVATAAAALAGARDWAVLKEMEAEGDYPEALWEYVDKVEQGKVPQGYESGLGCP